MRFNEVTTEELFAIIVKDENGIKRAIMNDHGAIMVLTLPREVYRKAKKNEIYRGYVNVVKRYMANPTYVGRGIALRAYTQKNDTVKKQQHVRKHVDDFLVKIKHDLYDRGYRAGTCYWDNEIQTQTTLYNVINGTNWLPSKDTKQWF